MAPVPTLSFQSFGVVAELTSDDRELLRAAGDMLPPGWEPADAPAAVRFGLSAAGAVTVDGAEQYREFEPGTALLRLASVVRHHVAQLAPSHVFIHAGVVEVAGSGIVIPGRTHSGKSTFVAELVRLGATYYSDEYAVVDRTGIVHPFAKPMSIRAAHDHGLGRLVEPPPAQVATDPVRCGLIVLTSYRAGARWAPMPRPTGEGAFSLLGNTVSARLQPGRALRAVGNMARGARVLAGQRGEARDAAVILLEHLDSVSA